MPEIVAMLEAGLMCQSLNHRSSRIREKEWLWDEYDEIWGFDMVPEEHIDYYMHSEALRDRHERGIPTLLDERDHVEFFAR
eukprot:5731953-Heterocapsa_arctica.AAC.1